MATLEHLTGKDRQDVIDRALDAFKAMAPGNLLLQDVLLRGVVDVLSTLIARGCEPAVAKAMLDDTMLTLGMVHGVARNRGIQLPEILKLPARLDS